MQYPTYDPTPQKEPSFTTLMMFGQWSVIWIEIRIKSSAFCKHVNVRMGHAGHAYSCGRWRPSSLRLKHFKHVVSSQMPVGKDAAGAT